MPCNITDYLAKKDKPLADALEQGCAGSKLSVRGVAGITFLWPQDKDVRAVLLKGLPSADDEKHAAAIELLNRHILVDAFPTTAAFAAAAGDIPNRNRKAVDAVVKGATVEFEGEGKDPAVASPVADFKVPRRSDLVIWKLKGKIAPGSRPATAYTRNERMKANKVKGGAESEDRRMISAHVESSWVSWRARGSSSPSPFQCHAEAVLACLRESYPDTYAALAPIVDADPMATWYILVEPYRRSGDYLVSASALRKVFHDWGGIKAGMAAPGPEIATAIAEGKKRITSGAAEAVRRVSDLIRAEHDDKSAASAVLKVYEELARSNRIDGHQYFPEETMRAVGARKLCQDELRYALASMVGDISGNYDQVATEFASVVSKLRMQYTGDGGCIVDNAQMKRLIPRAEIATIVEFARSPAFLYFAK